MVAENGKSGPHNNGEPHKARKVNGRTLFRIGTVVGTRGAAEVMAKHDLHPLVIAAMHASGIWGDIPAEDARLNERAVITGDRIMSVYRFGTDTLWVITDAGHETTTILTPDEY